MQKCTAPSTEHLGGMLCSLRRRAFAWSFTCLETWGVHHVRTLRLRPHQACLSGGTNNRSPFNGVPFLAGQRHVRFVPRWTKFDILRLSWLPQNACLGILWWYPWPKKSVRFYAYFGILRRLSLRRSGRKNWANNLCFANSGPKRTVFPIIQSLCIRKPCKDQGSYL